MKQGQVKWFNEKKGYGFIETEDAGDVFVHYSTIEGDGFKTLIQGQEVQYEAVDGPKGLHASLVLAPANDKKPAEIAREPISVESAPQDAVSL